MIQSKEGERVLLRRKANLTFPGFKKAVGTLFITNLRLSFYPIFQRAQIDIHFHSINKIELIKGIFKKIKVVTEKREYVIFVKGAENVSHLLKTLVQ